jgi:hypothetical protein
VVLDVGIVEHLVEGPPTAAVRDRAAAAVPPGHILLVVGGDVIRDRSQQAHRAQVPCTAGVASATARARAAQIARITVDWIRVTLACPTALSVTSQVFGRHHGKRSAFVARDAQLVLLLRGRPGQSGSSPPILPPVDPCAGGRSGLAQHRGDRQQGSVSKTTSGAFRAAISLLSRARGFPHCRNHLRRPAPITNRIHLPGFPGGE